MATSKNSPTAGETGTGGDTTNVNDGAGVTDTVTTQSGNQPVVSDGQVSEDRVAEQDRAQVEVSEGNPDGLAADVSDDFAIQNPGPVEEPSGDEKLAEEQAEELGGSGETWARYKASGNHMRGFTVRDQIEMGVPQGATIDNSADARPRTLTGGLEPGLWFTLQNRFRADVSEVHGVLREYLEEDDDFDVTTY